MSEEWVETSCCRQRLRSDGILEMRYKAGADHTLADVREEVSVVRRLVGEDGPVPLLVVLGKVRRQEPAAREHLVNSDEVAAVIRRTALVVATPVARVIATIFTQLRKPPMEMRIFSDETSAIRWLGGEVES